MRYALLCTMILGIIFLTVQINILASITLSSSSHFKDPHLLQIHISSGPTPIHENKLYRTVFSFQYGQLINVYKGRSRLNVDQQ